MAVDPSWDNFTNKLLPVRRVDRLIVWNELMKQQAVELHGYPPDEVRVAGTPQWDLYFTGGDDPATSREAFFRQIGADPSRKLITRDDDAARAVSASRSRAARADSRDARRRLAPRPCSFWSGCTRATSSTPTRSSKARRT